MVCVQSRHVSHGDGIHTHTHTHTHDPVMHGEWDLSAQTQRPRPKWHCLKESSINHNVLLIHISLVLCVYHTHTCSRTSPQTLPSCRIGAHICPIKCSFTFIPETVAPKGAVGFTDACCGPTDQQTAARLRLNSDLEVKEKTQLSP